ncbi:MAG: Ribonuclease family protein [Thermotoga sp.]|nr:Ribonuclease family protein [Thermotoga sp.]
MEKLFRFEAEPEKLPPAVLAYLGDAVLELIFRSRFTGDYRMSVIHERVKEHRKSTGFEALIGYLFLKREFDRIEELLRVVMDLESLRKKNPGGSAQE